MIDPRTKKRILIIIIFLLIFLGIVFFLYSVITPDASCIDGKLNQNEKDVDCGGICAPCADIAQAQDLKIQEKSFVFGGNDTYDGLIKLSNPNSSIGSSSFSYKAILRDDAGNVIDEKNGTGFILPAETKYIALTRFAVSNEQNPILLDFEISDVKWQEFTQYQKPQLSIYSKRFSLLSDIVGGEAYGVLKNESGFDFNSIKVNVILRDSENKLVGLNITQMNTVRSGDERDFTLVWPYQLPGEVNSVEAEAEANTYDTQNFLKTYIPDQKLPFQQY